MSPLESDGVPCRHIREVVEGEQRATFCGIYRDRPEECRDHDFPAVRYCPVGLDVLGISFEDDGVKATLERRRWLHKIYKERMPWESV